MPRTSCSPENLIDCTEALATGNAAALTPSSGIQTTPQINSQKKSPIDQLKSLSVKSNGKYRELFSRLARVEDSISKAVINAQTRIFQQTGEILSADDTRKLLESGKRPTLAKNYQQLKSFRDKVEKDLNAVVDGINKSVDDALKQAIQGKVRTDPQYGLLRRNVVAAQNKINSIISEIKTQYQKVGQDLSKKEIRQALNSGKIKAPGFEAAAAELTTAAKELKQIRARIIAKVENEFSKSETNRIRPQLSYEQRIERLLRQLEVQTYRQVAKGVPPGERRSLR